MATSFSWVPKTTKGISTPVIRPAEGVQWFSMDGILIDKEFHASEQQLEQIRKLVAGPFDQEVACFQKLRASSGGEDQKWINDIMKSGTLSDRIAAMTLVVQESPLHNLATLDSLLSIALKNEQRSATLAIDALKDLFIHNLLPDRPLRPLRTQPWMHPKMTLKAALLLWFEDQLISRYEKLIQATEIGLKANVDYFKKHCMEVSLDLLAAKPEKEARLLADVVNKLGDPSKSVISKCIELLKKLVSIHPVMKQVVVREIRQLIYRSGLPVRTIYTCILFLSQLTLTRKDSDVAASLVECYVGLFEKAVKEETLGSRLLTALLNGINHAFPYLGDTKPLAKHLDALFRIVHCSSFATATQALTLISHIAIGNQRQEAGPDSEKNGMEGSKPGKNKKGKRHSSSADATPASVNVSALPHGDEELVDRFYRALYSQLLAEEVASRTRNTLFINLLFRSLKRDPSIPRTMAFLKRLLMSVVHSSAPVAAGALFLVSEVCTTRSELKTAIFDEGSSLGSLDNQLSTTEHRNDIHRFETFDASKREPKYALEGRPHLWELHLLAQHYHPSVQAFARSLLAEPHEIKFEGDPTTEFGVLAFLNRFSFKNPKQRSDQRIHRAQASENEPINSAEFISQDVSEVAPDQQFYHKFFGERDQLRQEGKSRDRGRRQLKGLAADHPDRVGDGGSDGGEEGSDEEREIDRFADKLAEQLMRSHNNGDGFNTGDDDDDIDSLPDELDEEDDEDDGDSDTTVGFDDGQEDPSPFAEASDDDEEEEEEEGEEVMEDENDILDFQDFVSRKKSGDDVAQRNKKTTKKQLKEKKGKAIKRITDFDEPVEADDDENGDESGYQLMAYGDDENIETLSKKKKPKEPKKRSSVEEYPVVKEKSSKRAKIHDSLSTSSSLFADAADYEAEMEAIVRTHSLAADSTSTNPVAEGRRRKISKKRRNKNV